MRLVRSETTSDHEGDTFRELANMWEEAGYCTIEQDETAGFFTWVDAVGEVLLYEYPRFDVHPGLPPSWSLALFGNSQHHDYTARPWIFWPRKPRALEKKILEAPSKNYQSRGVKSVFLGKIENQIQLDNRTRHDWSSCTDFFNMPVEHRETPHRYSQEEYLDILSNSKFGIALPGYGPKCNREIEYFGLGVVPILVQGVCVQYHNPPHPGKHYFYANSPQEAAKIMETCSPGQWEDMSNNCIEWYNKNCSRKGSFETTLEIIETYR